MVVREASNPPPPSRRLSHTVDDAKAYQPFQNTGNNPATNPVPRQNVGRECQKMNMSKESFVKTNLPRRIKKVRFFQRCLGAKSRRRGVLHVTERKLYDPQRKPHDGGVLDTRLGQRISHMGCVRRVKRILEIAAATSGI